MATATANLKKLLEDANINIDDSDFFEEDDGMSSNASVENGSNRVRKIRIAFGAKYHMVLPVWLEFSFHPLTLEPLRKGKTIRSYQLGFTPADLIRAMIQTAAEDADYKKKLYDVLDIKEFLYQKRIDCKPEEFELAVSENGHCSADVGELFSKFFNYYMYSGVTQRYSINSERKVLRKALIPLKSSGQPDLDAADPAIAMAYVAESGLLYEEIRRREEESLAAGETAKTVEGIKTVMKSQRIMSPPSKSNFVFGFAFNVNGSHDFVPADDQRYKAASYKLQYAQTYFRLFGTDVAEFMTNARASVITNVNFVEFVRVYPEDSSGEGKGNLGLCAQKVTSSQVFTGKNIEKKLPNISVKIQEFLADPSNLDYAEIQKFIVELEDISVDEVMSAFSNNIQQYRLALKAPEIVEKNQKFLQAVNSTAGLTLVTGLANSNKVVFDAEELAKQSAAIDDTEYLDSDEEGDDILSADAFMPDMPKDAPAPTEEFKKSKK